MLDQVKRDGNRANRERKRLERKRSRAAKRRRVREEELVTRSTHTTKSARALGGKSRCGKSFACRKRRDRVVCPLRKEDGAELATRVGLTGCNVQSPPSGKELEDAVTRVTTVRRDHVRSTVSTVVPIVSSSSETIQRCDYDWVTGISPAPGPTVAVTVCRHC